ncbi:hypothetical protein ACLKA6_011552 [Drosophila palustris]
MSRLTEEMVIARSKQSDLALIKKLNCWGSDLSDVNIIKRMRGVEVLALSVNKINTLAPFEDCTKLQELYLRKNLIQNLNEISYLQNLPALKFLWLEENPCCETAGPNYRSIVLRALPNLKKLDNVEVTQEELDEALRGGGLKVEDDVYEDAYEPRQQTQRNSPQQLPLQHSPPQQQSTTQQQQQQQQQQQMQRRSSSPMKEEYYQSDRSPYPAHYRHSQTDLTEWEEHQQHQPPQVHHNPYGSQMQLHCQQQQRRSAGPETYRNGSTRENGGEYEEERSRSRPSGRFSDSVSNVSTTVMNHYSGVHRRPVNRNSNLLSACLCLIKELDYSSLEVLEHAVRCRIDELAGE